MVATEFQCSCMQLDRDFNLFLKMFHQTKYSLSVTSVTVNQSVLLKKTETSVSTLKRGIKLVITRLFFVIIYEILFAIMNYHCIKFFMRYIVLLHRRWGFEIHNNNFHQFHHYYPIIEA